MRKSFYTFINILFISMFSFNSVYGQIIIGDQKWKTGQVVKILFMNGTSAEKNLFEKSVDLWAQYVNLKFEFHSIEEDIRILPSKFKRDTIRVKFNKDEGNFSHVGNNFNIGVFSKVSYMNIAESADEKLKFVSKSLHEMGHALGLIHEHQHPDAKLYKNEEELIKTCKFVFLLDVRNSKELSKCKRNLTGISHADLEDYTMRISEFDVDSIMLYDGILEKKKNFLDTALSLGDKAFIASEYPFEEKLSLEDIKRMHNVDQEAEMQWIFSEYQVGPCKIIQEGDRLLITKQTKDRLIRVKLFSLSSVDSYFTACVRSFSE